MLALLERPSFVSPGTCSPRFAVPAGVVEDENDRPLAAGLRLTRESREQGFEERLRHAVVQIPEGLAGRGRHEGGDIKPIETMMSKRDGPFADRRPHPPRHRFQSEPMLVGCKHLDRSLWVLCRFLGDGVRELFLNAASSSGEAALGFLGRGVWIDRPHALSASQPR